MPTAWRLGKAWFLFFHFRFCREETGARSKDPPTVLFNSAWAGPRHPGKVPPDQEPFPQQKSRLLALAAPPGSVQPDGPTSNLSLRTSAKP